MAPRNNASGWSYAGPGEGVTDPKRVHKYNVFDGDERSGLIIRWEGNGYDKNNCWIQAANDDASLFDLDKIL